MLAPTSLMILANAKHKTYRSISLPLTWHANKTWQFTVAPAISFLPSLKGKIKEVRENFMGQIPISAVGFYGIRQQK